MAPLRLVLRPWERTAAAILNVVPLPGLGALLAGWRNAHTTLRRNGALQMALVVLGAWPLIVPGAVGLAWAIWDTVRIARARLAPLPSTDELATPAALPPTGPPTRPPVPRAPAQRAAPAKPRQAAPPKGTRR